MRYATLTHPTFFTVTVTESSAITVLLFVIECDRYRSRVHYSNAPYFISVKANRIGSDIIKKEQQPNTNWS